MTVYNCLAASTLKILKFNFDIEKYAPLHAEQSSESLMTKSNGHHCHILFIRTAVIILHVTVLGFVSSAVHKLVLSCLVYLTVCA